MPRPNRPVDSINVASEEIQRHELVESVKASKACLVFGETHDGHLFAGAFGRPGEQAEPAMIAMQQAMAAVVDLYTEGGRMTEVSRSDLDL